MMGRQEESVNENNEVVSSVKAYVSGNVNTGGGDFIGRDQQVFTDFGLFQYDDQSLSERERLNEQIKRLRGRVTRLIPAIELSDSLMQSKYRYEYRAEQKGFFRRFLSGFSFIFPRLYDDLLPLEYEKNFRYKDPDAYLSRLGEIESMLSTNETISSLFLFPWEDKDIPKWDTVMGEGKSDANIPLLQALNSLSDKINVRIARLNSQFIGYLNQAAGSSEFLENQIGKIGHEQIREEARTHYWAIVPLIERLNPEHYSKEEFDVLSDESYAALSIMAEIENRKNKIERLIQIDQRRRNITVLVVITYIAIALSGTIFIALQYGSQLSRVGPLADLDMPLIGVPWPVVVWALIGSFAAMIHRFNKKPIHDFGDAVKWMLTRPVQGVVLGAAFYLVVISGLFLVTGVAQSESATGPMDEVILILAFLVGFSDRFADNVFNTLMASVSKTNEPPQQEQKEKNI